MSGNSHNRRIARRKVAYNLLTKEVKDEMKKNKSKKTKKN